MQLAKKSEVAPTAIAAMEQYAKEKYPGSEVVYGEADGIDPVPEEMQKQLQELQMKFDLSLTTGTCVDCGEELQDYPSESIDIENDKDFVEDWRPPDDWGWLHDNDNVPVAWLCPTCYGKAKVNGTELLDISEVLNKQ